MEQQQLTEYKNRFLEECKNISNGLSSRVINNREIGDKFPELPKKDRFMILDHLEQDGYISVPANGREPFLNMSMIKSFTLTQKALQP